jgi:hypothetical protein
MPDIVWDATSDFHKKQLDYFNGVLNKGDGQNY